MSDNVDICVLLRFQAQFFLYIIRSHTFLYRLFCLCYTPLLLYVVSTLLMHLLLRNQATFLPVSSQVRSLSITLIVLSLSTIKVTPNSCFLHRSPET